MVLSRAKRAPKRRVATRREEYAEATRQAIIAAARRLFRDKGYFATKVEDIAELARVAPVTVYAVSGGKHELLRTLMGLWTTAPIVGETLDRIRHLDDPRSILAVAAAAQRVMREEFGDIIHTILFTAPHDATAAQSLAVATERYRGAIAAIVRRLDELGALRDGIDVNQAVDVAWFFFGYWSLFALNQENGWALDKAEAWLRDAAIEALLRQPVR